MLACIHLLYALCVIRFKQIKGTGVARALYINYITVLASPLGVGAFYARVFHFAPHSLSLSLCLYVCAAASRCQLPRSARNYIPLARVCVCLTGPRAGFMTWSSSPSPSPQLHRAALEKWCKLSGAHQSCARHLQTGGRGRGNGRKAIINARSCLYALI